jgi:phosphoribosyl 1,2-cyclic phosphodiesterase
LRACVLGSGSSGNAIYIESGATRILVDAGLSAREVERRLREVGVDPYSLSAILVSHEHIDHVRSAGVLARRYKPRLWANASTLKEVGHLLTGHERVEEFSNGCGW